MNAPSAQTGPARLHTASGAHPLELRLAGTFLSRFCGLMLSRALPPGQGLLITRCPSVHSLFMRYPLDIVYLDQGGLVTRCTPGLKPWRASSGQSRLPGHATAHTLELPAGSIQHLGIEPGDRLQHPAINQPPSVTRHA